MTVLSTRPTQSASAWFADFESAMRAVDLDAAMALVTMVQRDSAHIAPSDSLRELALGGL